MAFVMVNLVVQLQVTGGDAWEEDTYQKMRLGECGFTTSSPNGRCVVCRAFFYHPTVAFIITVNTSRILEVADRAAGSWQSRLMQTSWMCVSEAGGGG